MKKWMSRHPRNGGRLAVLDRRGCGGLFPVRPPAGHRRRGGQGDRDLVPLCGRHRAGLPAGYAHPLFCKKTLQGQTGGPAIVLSYLCAVLIIVLLVSLVVAPAGGQRADVCQQPALLRGQPAKPAGQPAGGIRTEPDRRQRNCWPIPARCSTRCWIPWPPPCPRWPATRPMPWAAWCRCSRRWQAASICWPARTACCTTCGAMLHALFPPRLTKSVLGVFAMANNTFSSYIGRPAGGCAAGGHRDLCADDHFRPGFCPADRGAGGRDQRHPHFRPLYRRGAQRHHPAVCRPTSRRCGSSILILVIQQGRRQLYRAAHRGQRHRAFGAVGAYGHHTGRRSVRPAGHGHRACRCSA